MLILDCERGCPYIYDPQCGSDGKTYPNMCMFENAQCKDPSLKLVHSGQCKKGKIITCDMELSLFISLGVCQRKE